MTYGRELRTVWRYARTRNFPVRVGSSVSATYSVDSRPVEATSDSLAARKSTDRGRNVVRLEARIIGDLKMVW